MIIGDKIFPEQEGPYVMGILNVTPDSFSDGGSYVSLDAALRQAEKMVAEGATILDVGGESTRPGYTKISDEEEIGRVCPVIEKLVQTFDVPVSLDTYKAGVAEAGLKAGAHMINDIWGLTYDERMASVVASYEASVCIMHNRKEAVYEDFQRELLSDLSRMIEIAVDVGISKDKIMIDPGVGFAKSYNENLLAIRNVGELKNLGYPILLGTSRKSVVGLTLDLPVSERVEGTIATNLYGYLEGCLFFRVHDVKEHVRALKMLSAIRR